MWRIEIKRRQGRLRHMIRKREDVSIAANREVSMPDSVFKRKESTNIAMYELESYESMKWHKEGRL